MVKREIYGIPIPEVASNEELREFVYAVFDECSSNYLQTGAALDVSAATIWKMINKEQDDSPVLREKWGIRKTAKRPRVWMPTNNLKRALEVLRAHYPEVADISLSVEEPSNERYD